jgi:cation transport regulator ChaB
MNKREDDFPEIIKNQILSSLRQKLESSIDSAIEAYEALGEQSEQAGKLVAADARGEGSAPLLGPLDPMGQIASG